MSRKIKQKDNVVSSGKHYLKVEELSLVYGWRMKPNQNGEKLATASHADSLAPPPPTLCATLSNVIHSPCITLPQFFFFASCASAFRFLYAAISSICKPWAICLKNTLEKINTRHTHCRTQAAERPPLTLTWERVAQGAVWWSHLSRWASRFLLHLCPVELRGWEDRPNRVLSDDLSI